MHIFREASALRAWVRGQKQQGHRVGFVPTMGNLHAGHFSLIEIARRHCDRIVASVFVNPTQFGEGEDFDRYPRTPDADAKGLRDHGCDALFLPEAGEIYPFGAAQGVCVHVPGLSDALEGAARPGHFDGVLTVVMKLLNITLPDHAYFGEKDFQQLRLCGSRRFSNEIVLIVIDDAVHGAGGNAGAAARAGCFVDDRNAVDHMNRIGRTLLFAALAADAGGFTLHSGNAPRRFVSAEYNDRLILVQHLNDTARAGCNAHAAAGTDVFVDHRNALDL